MEPVRMAGYAVCAHGGMAQLRVTSDGGQWDVPVRDCRVFAKISAILMPARQLRDHIAARIRGPARAV